MELKFNKFNNKHYSKAISNFLLPDNIASMTEDDLIDNLQFLSIKYYILDLCRENQNLKNLNIYCEEFDQIITPETVTARWENKIDRKVVASFNDGKGVWVELITFPAYQGKTKIQMYAMQTYDPYSAIYPLYFYFQ
tara:strand:+ start:198 stop:608 length:411 start_codon:yes stop_codon:yes gene_type:complete